MSIEESVGRSRAHDPEGEVIAFLEGRSAPCPRCGYDLRDIQSAKCPECGELLELKVGSAKPRFGWLVLAMAPGCFSGVAAVFVMVPILMGFWLRLPASQRAPWPVWAADIFGWVSALTVAVMYRYRHRIMAWPTRRQVILAGAVWAVHVTATGVLIAWLATL